MNHNEYLAHHGILGMSWGKRNGPPYPLDAPDHSAAEKKAGWRKSLDKKNPEEYNKRNKEVRRVEDPAKNLLRVMKVGTALAVSAMAAYGGYRLYQSGALNQYVTAGKELLNRVQNKRGQMGVHDLDVSQIAETIQNNIPTDTVSKIKKLSSPESISDTLKNTNPKFGQTGYIENCTYCAVAAFLRQLGFDVKAGKVESGGQHTENLIQRLFKVDLSYDDSRLYQLERGGSFAASPDRASVLLKKKFGDDAEGIISVNTTNLLNQAAVGHAFNWKIVNGVVTFFDSQNPDGSRNDKWIREVLWSRIAPEGQIKAIRLDGAEPIIEQIVKEFE